MSSWLPYFHQDAQWVPLIETRKPVVREVFLRRVRAQAYTFWVPRGEVQEIKAPDCWYFPRVFLFLPFALSADAVSTFGFYFAYSLDVILVATATGNLVLWSGHLVISSQCTGRVITEICRRLGESSRGAGMLFFHSSGVPLTHLRSNLWEAYAELIRSADFWILHVILHMPSNV